MESIIRQDATLNKQAKLINMFAEKDIWNNVIIICKLKFGYSEKATKFEKNLPLKI